MRANSLSKKSCRLLPLALSRDVTVVSPAKREDREKMSFVLEIIAQPAPCSGIRRSNLRERRWAELGIFYDECSDFHCIHVTDRSEAASPGITVAVRRQQVPPQFHLLLKRRCDGLHKVFTPREGRGIIEGPGILIGISIIPAGRQCIVSKECAAGEL